MNRSERMDVMDLDTIARVVYSTERDREREWVNLLQDVRTNGNNGRASNTKRMSSCVKPSRDIYLISLPVSCPDIGGRPACVCVCLVPVEDALEDSLPTYEARTA